jgi:uncharacterized protein (TIGR02145 family)
MGIDASYNSTRYNASEKHRGICPEGWHIPSGSDWYALMNYVQTDNKSTYTSGSNASISAKHLKAEEGWKSYSGISNTDAYGFAALPGGSGEAEGSFEEIGERGRWWSALELNNNNAYYSNMYYVNDVAYWNLNSKAYLRSVRCVKD